MKLKLIVILILNIVVCFQLYLLAISNLIKRRINGFNRPEFFWNVFVIVIIDALLVLFILKSAALINRKSLITSAFFLAITWIVILLLSYAGQESFPQ